MINKIKNISYLISFIIIAYSVYLYVDVINLYGIKKIEIRGNNFVKENAIKTILNKYKNKNINTVSIKNIQSDINYHPYINSNKAFKMLPNRIVVNIKEIVPIALIEKNETIYFLDTNLDEIKINNESLNHYSVPIITNKKNQKYDNIGEILKLIRYENINFYNSINEIIISEDITTIKIEKGTKIKLNNSNKMNNTLKLLSFLETIKNNKKITDYKYVDLTIPQQIIVKENKKS